MKPAEVYVQTRKGRPVPTGETVPLGTAPPLTWTHGGRTYYFATLDLTRGYVTYTEDKPQAIAA